jgi:tetraacyldisaccharide 4'-kinase
VYWIIAVVRNWFFEIGVGRIARLDVPVVSVGNISTGGSGKTPFVEFIVNKLKAGGHRPAVVSRGYGRETRGYVLVSDAKGIRAGAKEGGDEPVLLAEKMRGTPVAVGENRAEASRTILKETGADCIVLDDGFQHRYIHRDLNIVLLTAPGMFSRRWLLPAGNWRETLGSLGRADLVVISKCSNEAEYNRALQALREKCTVRAAGFRYESTSLYRVPSNAPVDESTIVKSRVVIAAGIGDFGSFRNSVEKLGCRVERSFEFRDHYWYTESNLGRMRDIVRSQKADFLITTEKDYVRMRTLGARCERLLSEVPVAVLEVKLRFIAGEEVIDELMKGIFA